MGTTTAAVVGATGYAARELCRLLLQHPNVGAILPTARGDDVFERVHPNLLGSGLEFLRDDQLPRVDVVFFCTPAGAAMRDAPRHLEAGALVVDVSADYRFPDPTVYEEVYGESHASAELLDEAACGITELHRDRIKGARLVANPGCYVIAAVLALAPLVGADLIDPAGGVHVHAVNGTSGAGSTPRRDLLHAEVTGSMLTYSLDGHRHAPEIDARLAELGANLPPVDLGTAHGNFVRGIRLEVSVTPRRPVGRDDLLALYRERYGAGHDGEHFVRVVDFPKSGGRNAKEYDVYPKLGSVVGSNFCDIGIDIDARIGTVRIVSVIDNLVKGAAGSAVQNMNVMLGIDETTGLRQYGL